MYLGIDIGGTKTLVASFDGHGQLTEKVRFSSPQDYQSFSRELKASVATLSAKDFKYCGVGMPGLVDRETGRSKWAGGNLAWESCPLGDDVSAIVGCPVAVENDANLAGLSEAKLVQDRYPTALYITISTGIGGVFVVDGAIDPSTADAEIGHMIYPSGNGHQTWEQLTSGKAIVDKYGRRADEINDPETWEAVSEQIAVGLINLSAVLTPKAIILGGGVGGNLHRFKAYLDESLERLTPAAVTVPPILEAQHPDEAVLYGCYELAKQRS